ncbi:hypothetical protein BU15DRAFT_79256 [Melanogaster broomeanus]|nr:hypothetical protein BU15DRAFT_79256 [Melanogaster broomeanus]
MPSLTATALAHSPTIPLKRTSSFFEPVPRKTSRMTLRRTESFLSLSDYNDENQPVSGSFLYLTSSPSPHAVPYNRTLLYYKEQRERNKLGRKRPEFTIASGSSKAQLSKHTTHLQLGNCFHPDHPFPRSKPEPDLYRVALKARMRSSPEGEKILRMGPRLAITILSATRELERIVSAQEDDMMMDDTDYDHWGIGHGHDMGVACAA